MIVTITDIQNAIYKAQNMVYAIALNITDCYEQGGQPSDEKYELATQLQSYIDVLGRVDLDENDCIDSDEIWEIISWINGNQVLAEMCLVIPAQYSNPGQPIPVPDAGCCGVETVTGPQVDNTDPKHPVVGVYGDGSTITGAGTFADPFVAVGGGGGATFATQMEVDAGAVTNKVISPKTFNDSAQLAALVPYTGATANVDLGLFDILAAEAILTAQNIITAVFATHNVGTGGNYTTNIHAFYAGLNGNADYLTASIEVIMDGTNVGDGRMTIKTEGTSTINFKYGNVGIGSITVPTARLHIPAVGTGAGTAPIKLTLGGTLMTTPEAGAIEAINTHIYWTDSTGTRFQLDQQGGGGSGTVNSGTQYRIAYYATTGTAVSEAGAITGSRALKSDANGVPIHFDTATEPSLTELAFVKGLQSSAQTQLDQRLIVIVHQFTAGLNPADATVYYIGEFPQLTLTISATGRKSKLPYDYTIIAANIQIITAGTLATNENSTLAIRINNTTDTTVSSIVKFNAVLYQEFVSGLAIDVLSTDDFQSKLTTATWVTNPTTPYGTITYYAKRKV